MNRLERLYALSEAVRRKAGQPVSTALLAQEFEVSRRTIERDLASLRHAGVPLYGEQGRNGGVASLESSAGAVVSLSTAEITALLVAVAAGGADMAFSADASTATKRLLDGLAPTTRIQVEGLRDKIRCAVVDKAVQPRLRRTVEEAVRRGVVVNLTYVDRDERVTTRSVDANGFFKGDNCWHLIGWCHLREDGRLFRLDRIESARITRRPIEERDVDEVLGWVPTGTTVP